MSKDLAIPAKTPFSDSGQILDEGSTSAEDIASQIASQSIRLKFKRPELEAGFLNFSKSYGLTQVRVAYALLIVLIGVFGFSDLYAFPLETAKKTLSVRLGFIVPVLIYAYWRTRQAKSAVPLYPVFVVGAVVSSIGGVLVVYFPYAMGLDAHYEGLMLFMFGIGGFMGLRFAHATWVLIFMVVLYAATQSTTDATTSFIFNSTYRLTCAALISAAAGYMGERQTRSVYLHRILLERHAHRDGLTGIANRRAFDLHAARAVQLSARENKPLTVAILDADHFKQYNDTYGHLKGDDCLQQLASVIGHMARRPMDMAARYGGEEFVLLLFDMGEEESMAMMAKLQMGIKSLALEHKGSPMGGYVTVSGGVCTRLAGQMQPLSQMLAEADKALYKAKATGRNRFVHSSMEAFSPGHPA